MMDDREIGISRHTHWSQLEDYRELARGMGIFILADDEHEVKFIGQAGSGNLAEDIDAALASGKGRSATGIKALYTPNSQSTRHIYKILLNKYQPPENLG